LYALTVEKSICPKLCYTPSLSVSVLNRQVFPEVDVIAIAVEIDWIRFEAEKTDPIFIQLCRARI